MNFLKKFAVKSESQVWKSAGKGQSRPLEGNNETARGNHSILTFLSWMSLHSLLEESNDWLLALTAKAIFRRPDLRTAFL